MQRIILTALACLIAGSAQAESMAQERVVSPHGRNLPTAYFTCQVDTDCVQVQGWCTWFAINQSSVAAYNALPQDPQGKDSTNCPTDRRPAYPHALCTQQLCSVGYGQR